MPVTDWNPLDPDFENVFYDMSSWSSAEQGEATAMLANADIPHAWVEHELVVPADHEQKAEAILNKLEQALGIGSSADKGGVDEGDDVTEFELDEYTVAERRDITEQLIANRVTHRWVETTLIVPTSAEDVVDGILDDFDGGVEFVDDVDDDD